MLLASVDGAITPSEEATIPVTDEGLLRGDGAFEVIRLYDGRPYAFQDHLDRLGRSAAGLRLEFDLNALRSESEALLAECGPADALLRLVVTRGGRRIAIVEPLPDTPETARVCTIEYVPNRVLDGLKTLSYAANMLAGRLAREKGFDEALLVTPHGRVLEGPTWTFFWVADGTLCTPPLEERVLDSITRRKVQAVAEVEERICTLDDLKGAEEAFIASTLREGLPIAAIDDLELPAAPGPVTTATRDALQARIASELEGGAS
jgi:branched-chain amino acid aminotransferase